MSCGIVTGGNEYLLVRERDGEKGGMERREGWREGEKEGTCQVRNYNRDWFEP